MEVGKQRTHGSQLEVIARADVKISYEKHEVQMLMIKWELLYQEFKGFEEELQNVMRQYKIWKQCWGKITLPTIRIGI